MKIKPSKFHISQRVKFGRCILEANPNNNSIEISPHPKKVDELLGREPPKSKKEVQSIIESMNQLAA